MLAPAKRKKIESKILEFCNEVDPSGLNAEIYSESFKNMNDDDIAAICKDFRIYAPSGSKVDIDHMRNIKLCRKYGYEPFQQAWLTDPTTGVTSLTKKKHMIFPGVIRRQTQAWEKKVAIPEHNRRLDKLTGAVTGSGVSKGSSFSGAQALVMNAQGYKFVNREFMNIRGGNVKAAQVIDRQIRQYGSSSQAYPGMQNHKVKSTKTLSAFYTAQHIGNTLGKNNV